MSIANTPGLLTVSEQDFNRCAQLRRNHFEWISFQAQNGSAFRDFDLGPAKDAGLSPGVWGVSYVPDSFWYDGYYLGRQAVWLGANHVTMDVEQAAKGTRGNRGLKPIIAGLRASGWSGPVHLNTLGPPVNPSVNDYAIDLQSFLETGGGVQTQCYANAYDSYAPELGVPYWTRVGVPRDRLNIQVSLYAAEQDAQYPGRAFSGYKWVELLKAAGVKREISIFMAEAALDADLAALKELITPVTTVDVAQNRLDALAKLKSSVDFWRAYGHSEATIALQRQTLAWRVLNMPLSTVNQKILVDALDKALAPKP